jgi:hypothetical protein
MSPEQAREFDALVIANLERWFRRNGRFAVPAAECAGVAERLRSLLAEKGLPRVPPGGRPEEAGELPAEECAAMERCVLGPLGTDELWATPVRQLVKACLQPEFRRCRDSYREREADGSCRRQQAGKARGRLSGSPCVDCPYWLELTVERHARVVRDGWAGDVAAFESDAELYLPSDFRALRRHVRACAQG